MKSCYLSLFVLGVLSFYQTVLAQAHFQMLNGNDWEFKETGQAIWRPAKVPGSVHTDLMEAKALPDPFWRDNEKWVQWVSNLDWEYKKQFQVESKLWSRDSIFLNFKGLDTYAEVYLNGKMLFSSTNMFMAHRVEVKKYLSKEQNELRVLLKSPIREALPDAYSYRPSLPAVNDAMPLKLSPFTRKAGYHYGWDWGPRLLTSGIWREVFLEANDSVGLSDVFLRTTEISDRIATIEAKISIDGNLPAGSVLEFEMGLQKFRFPIVGKSKVQQVTIQLKNPKLWWSHDQGSPHLYAVKVQLFNAQKKKLDQRTFSFGVRTIELVHEKDAMGKSFYFKLNGKPVFMKGANYIPQDNFLNRVDKKRSAQLLWAAKQAHMNMIRIWGGGVYEDDLFYSLCDSLGILVWQDFMFACTMYPGTEKFLAEVEQEVKQNVVRLRNFASVALWCGNNENETGWLKRWIRGGLPYSPMDSAKVYEDYKELFHRRIPKWLSELDPGRPYTRSSPSANDDDIKPDKKGFGDMHDWNVWFGTGDYRAYSRSVSRFQSEYGYQSFPTMPSIRRFSQVQDWFEDSDVMDVHQKHTNGNAKIRRFSAEFYPKPSTFEQFCYISQLQQAEAMRFALETHRAHMPYCMGSLYWQLNDCWPAASWSSIDYYGTWKAAHYFIRRANESVRLIGQRNRDSLHVYLVNEGQKPIQIQDLFIEVLALDGSKKWEPQRVGRLAATACGQVAKLKIPISQFMQMKDTAHVWLRLSLGKEVKGLPALEDVVFLSLPKDLKLPKAELQWKIAYSKEGKCRLTLKSPVLIKNLYVFHPEQTVNFSDNFFDLLPGEIRTIEVQNPVNTVFKEDDFQFLYLNPK